MINWIKYDPENPPETGRYLISDETDVEVGMIFADQWYSDGDMGMGHSEVTHYAHINLPGDDKADE